MRIYPNDCLPYNPKLTERAKELRKNMTSEERKLWYCFLSKHILHFLRQKVIDNYIVDFYCSEARLAIEVDGSYHYTENGIEYDKIRTNILSAYGVKVIRFSNKDVNFNFKLVCRKIEEARKIPQSTDVDSPLIKGAED